jgi:asparagine synthase (glutamine-hydrolysing)
MLRFFAIVWNGFAQEQPAEAARLCQLLGSGDGQWHYFLSADGLAVFHTGVAHTSPDVHLLGNDGILFGKIFKHDDGSGGLAPSLTFEEAESARVLSTGGRRLIQGYWGRYVAFIRDSRTRTIRILRSPAGALNCFEAQSGDVRVFFSDVRDYMPLCASRFSINWSFVATLLAFPRHAMGSAATGITEIGQLQPGECIVCAPDGAATKELLWNPFTVASSDLIEDFTTATDAIRIATTHCVWNWASCYPRLIHLLSGGFDSSIVLYCLSTAPTRPVVTCVNYFDRHCITGDERAYARATASRAECRLVEVEDSSSDVDLSTILRLAKHPVPWSYLLHVRHSPREGELARSTASSAIFSGTGGDQIFFYGPTTLAAADFLRRYGLIGGFFPYALAVARRNRHSLWAVIRTALRERFAAPGYDAVRDHEAPNQLIAREAVAVADRATHIRHYWLPFARNVSHGKLMHILMTDCTQDLQDPFGAYDYPERVHPLNSQPLMEVCLRIPTYILTHGGRSRAAARHAFRGDLAPKVASRTSKGFIDYQNAELLLRHLGTVRELLLDGLLVAERLLDRRKLERLLTPDQTMLSPEAGEALCEHLSYEAWLRNWVDLTCHTPVRDLPVIIRSSLA